MACHGPDGTGLKVGAQLMAPSLAHSEVVVADPEVSVLTVLKGIVRDATSPFLGIMAPLGTALDDRELAAVLTFVRNSFGNNAGLVTVEQTRAARQKFAKLKNPVKRSTIDALLAKAAEKGHEPGLAASVRVAKNPTAAASQSRFTTPKQTSDGLVDIDFEGGSLLEFVALLSTLDNNLNVVVAPTARQANVPELHLKQVSLETAFELLEFAMIAEPKQIRIRMVDGNFVIAAQENSTLKKQRPTVKSFPLSQLPETDVEDVFSLITRAFEMKGGELPEMQFHAETGTLLATVTPDQDVVLRDLVSQITQAKQSVGITRDELESRLELNRKESDRTREEFLHLAAELEDRKSAGESSGSAKGELQILEKEILRTKLIELNKKQLELEDQLRNVK